MIDTKNEIRIKNRISKLLNTIENNQDEKEYLRQQIGFYKSIMKRTKDYKNNKTVVDAPFFRGTYCYFYAINTRQKAEQHAKWLKKYFMLLKEYLNKNEVGVCNLPDIIQKLEYLGGKKMRKQRPLSYASKLLHTCNPDLPIYDTNVFATLKKYDLLEGKENIEKYNNYVTNRIMANLIEKNRYEIKRFREIFHVIDGISDVKVMDFILWRIKGT